MGRDSAVKISGFFDDPDSAVPRPNVDEGGRKSVDWILVFTRGEAYRSSRTQFIIFLKASKFEVR